MKHIRFMALLLGIAVLPSLPLSAYMVSFIVVETGLPLEYPTADASQLWENGVLDVFFEAGHIVSNARIFRLEDAADRNALPESIQTEFNEAVEGGAQFFVLVMLDYFGPVNTVPRPQEITIRLFGTRPYRLLLEQKYPGSISTPLSDELLAAKDAATRLESQVR